MVSPRPWISVDEGRVTPTGGETNGEIDHPGDGAPEGAVRLNDPICPVAGVSVKENVDLAPAGGDVGESEALALGGAAFAAGTMNTAIAASATTVAPRCKA